LGQAIRADHVLDASNVIVIGMKDEEFRKLAESAQNGTCS